MSWIGSLVLFAFSNVGETVHQATFMGAVLESVEKDEYSIRWDANQAARFSANRAQNLRFTYYDDGFAFEPRTSAEAGRSHWQVAIRLHSFGKGARNAQALGPSRWDVQENRARVSQNELTIEYDNWPEGMRQSFWVWENPGGSEPLRFDFQVTAVGVDLVVNEDLDRVSFVYSGTAEEAAYYTDLSAWDASHQVLEARMMRTGERTFAIVINDERAIYPVFVDPIINIGRWAEQNSSQYGYSVAIFGRLGPSGPGGVIVGAPYYDTATKVNAGKVFIYENVVAYPPEVPPTYTIEGDQANSYFGWSVANAGDVNLNGSEDVIVGAPYYDSGGFTDSGKVLIYGGVEVGVVTDPPLWQKAGWQSGMHFGFSVAGNLNLNYDSGDRAKDFIIGSPHFDYGGFRFDAGLVEVYHGDPFGAPPDTTADWFVMGDADYLHLGYSVANAGDTKRLLGFQDSIIIGAPGPPAGIAEPGRAYVYYSDGYALGYNPTVLTGERGGDQFGFSVAGIGESQVGDTVGYHDVLVGAPACENYETDEGKAYLFRGSSAGVYTSSAWTVESNQTGARLGWSVAGGPVYENEGAITPGLLIGIPYYDDTNVDNGEARFYLITNGTPVLDSRIMGVSSPYAYNGWSVAVGQTGFQTRGMVVGSPGGRTTTVWRYTP